ncbi:F-box domain-containing protein [Mycena indigotica]|uniref:F-box domain-containing protein n=1 Tax=Mycena indigotica TaxID=2126181 RepID=A0A8H6S3J6_9AGAR|nr:F-box domain-containing protein [Mycena indigotica]KAF7292101.1 F-box domain-containing protein [Mycena indigotica]
MDTSPPTPSPPSPSGLPAQTQTQLQHAAVIGLLRSGTTPGSGDARHLQQLLGGLTTEVARFDAVIAAKETEISQVKEARESLQRYASATESLLAPIRRLPPELLGKVFVALIALPSVNETRLERLGNARVVRITGVCYLWHSLVHKTPQLWTNIHANIDDSVPPALAEHLIAVSLQRSAGLPLDVHVQLRPMWTLGLFQTLLDQCERWENAELALSHAHVELLSAARPRFPLLETLDLLDMSLTGMEQLDTFQHAPLLSHVTVYDDPPLLPWSQIREIFSYIGHLASNADELQGIFGFVGHCSTLCTVVIPEIHLDMTTRWTLPPSPTIISNVGALRIGISNIDDAAPPTRRIIGSLLALLNLPDLRQLVIHSASATALLWPQEAFSAFCLRSSSITRLRLADVLITHDELIASLRSLSALRELALEDVHDPKHLVVTDQLLSRLSWAADAGSECLVRDLRYMSLRAFFECADAALLTMVESRAHVHRPFRLEATVLSAQTDDPNHASAVALATGTRLTALFAGLVKHEELQFHML